MSMNNTFGIPGASRGEQQQRVAVEVGSAVADFGIRRRLSARFQPSNVQRFDSLVRQHSAQGLIRVAVEYRESGGGRPGERLDLERRQARVDGDDSATEAPDGDQIDEQLQFVAEMEKDAVAGSEASPSQKGDPALYTKGDLFRLPVASGERFNQGSYT